MKASGDEQVRELNDKLARGAKRGGFGVTGIAHSRGLTVLGLPDQFGPLLSLTHVRTLRALGSSEVVR